jgi:O-acetyl-ADP-ribose deacetylase (regulator of RNase III)
MIIETIEGDLLKMFEAGEFDGIAHGCNCYHMMGAGIAAQVASKFPNAFKADKRTKYGNGKIGSYSFAPIHLGTIYNMYTQDQGGKEDQELLIATLKCSFKKLNGQFKHSKAAPLIGIPMIGAGIAGGNWERHVEAINSVTPDLDIIYVQYKP